MSRKTGTDMLMVGLYNQPGHEPVLTVGTMNKNTVEIINAFKGDEAIELFKKLKGVEKNEKDTDTI